jgi:hypothetical protein
MNEWMNIEKKKINSTLIHSSLYINKQSQI